MRITIGSRHIGEWLHSNQLSFTATTYQAGKWLFLGTMPECGFAAFECDGDVNGNDYVQFRRNLYCLHLC